MPRFKEDRLTTEERAVSDFLDWCLNHDIDILPFRGGIYLYIAKDDLMDLFFYGRENFEQELKNRLKKYRYA